MQHFSAHVATYIRERVWHPSQRLRQRRDGWLEMRLETLGHKKFVRWVLSWVPDVKVLAPQLAVPTKIAGESTEQSQRVWTAELEALLKEKFAGAKLYLPPNFVSTA